MKKLMFILCVMAFVHSPLASADEFSISFEWGDIPLCNTGKPNTVSNPRFELTNVPDGTKFIYFKMKDLDVPQYDHGGGVVEFTGQSIIEPGAFTYRSPCPPGGSHTYQWEATAKSKKSMFGGKLGKAQASVDYPN